jgi:hypothetical protein
MTATHKFPMPTVSFHLTTSVGPAKVREVLAALLFALEPLGKLDKVHICHWELPREEEEARKGCAEEDGREACERMD